MTPLSLLFDLDGTLIDSAADLAQAVNETLAEAAGKPPLPLDDIRVMIGDGVSVLLTRCWAASGLELDPKVLIAEILPLFQKHYAACGTRTTAAYPGVAQTLAALQAAGHGLAICTNKPLVPTLAILDVLDLRRFFPAIVCGDTQPERKPAPEPLCKAIADLGGDRRHAVMIGDSINDELAARAAGIPFVLIPSGYGTPASGGDAVIERFTDLPGALAMLA